MGLCPGEVSVLLAMSGSTRIWWGPHDSVSHHPHPPSRYFLFSAHLAANCVAYSGYRICALAYVLALRDSRDDRYNHANAAMPIRGVRDYLLRSA